MPRNCTICNHLQRSEIEAALLENLSFRHIASRYATSTASIQRHKQACIAKTLMKASEAKEVAQADTLLERLKSINADTLAILKEARTDKNGELALKAIARVEKQIELEGKLIGELNDAPQVNLNIGIERLQVIISNALANFPDARIVVAQALMEARP